MAGYSRPSMLLDLFPAIQPYSTGFLEVSDVHSLYWEQSGNPGGVPVVLLHGGPGAGTSFSRSPYSAGEYGAQNLNMMFGCAPAGPATVVRPR